MLGTLLLQQGEDQEDYANFLMDYFLINKYGLTVEEVEVKGEEDGDVNKAKAVVYLPDTTQEKPLSEPEREWLDRFIPQPSIWHLKEENLPVEHHAGMPETTFTVEYSGVI